MVAMTRAHEAAGERLRARAARLRAIRRRVAATALTTFVLAFGVITATGSMGGQTTTATANVSTAATSTPAATAPTATATAPATSSGSSTPSSTPSPVVTRQS
jgi:hypothetical protein